MANCQTAYNFQTPPCPLCVPTRSKTYCIPGDPVPLARHRHSGKKAWDSQRQLKFAIGLQLLKQHNNEPFFKGPLHLEVFFFCEIPSSRRKKEQLHHKPHYYKPDSSNLLKLVEDCANNIIFKDDAAIFSTYIQKVYSNEPKTIFTVYQLL
jgi:Holliday junction resolvase RusA-like endonuclease